MKNTLRYAFIAIIFFLVYWITFPENRTETDDGYEYALSIKTMHYEELFLNRCLFFKPLVKLGYDSLHAIGIHVDAYQFMCFLSCFFSAVSLVLLYHILIKYVKLSILASAVAIVLTGFSYGYWRYATEADLYPMATCLILCTFTLFMKWYHTDKLSHLFVTAIVAAISVLIYKLSFIPLFIALPLLFIAKRKYKEAILYYGIGGILVLTGHFIAFKISSPIPVSFVGFLSEGLPRIEGGNRLKFLLVFISNFLTSTWIYGFPNVLVWIQTNFQNKYLVEEAFLSKAITWEKFVSLGILIVLGIEFMVLSFRAFAKKAAFKFDGIVIPFMVWILLYGLFLLVYDPYSPEPWLMLITPLMLLITILLIEPSVKAGSTALVVSFAFLFVLYNYVGGIGVMRSRDHDYYFAKSKDMLQHAAQGDIILTCESKQFAQFLKYQTLAEVPFETDTLQIKSSLAVVLQNQRSVIFSDDVIDIPQTYLFYAPERARFYQNLLKEFQYEVIGKGDFTTYRLIGKNEISR